MIETQLHISPLTPAAIRAVKLLADASVGEGFYSEADLGALCGKDSHFCNLLWSGAELVGYNYNYLAPLSDAADALKLPEAELRAVSGAEQSARIGVCKSMGVSPLLRGRGLATALFSYGVRELWAHGAQSLWGTAWKLGDRVPMRGIFDSLGFIYLHDLSNVWNDVEGLHCPACNMPRCICGAALFYRLREELH